MLDLAMLIVHELQWSASSQRCHFCSGLNPEYHQIAKKGERLGHVPGCKIRFLNQEYEAMRYIL